MAIETLECDPVKATSVFPIDLSAFLERVEQGIYGPFAEHGLPLVDYDRYYARQRVRHDGKIGIHATPVTIALFGLAHHALFARRGRQSSRSKFLSAADWLVSHQVDDRNTGGVWLNFFPMPNLPPLIEYTRGAWISGMAQGLGISLLLRAYAETEEWKYLDAATAATLPFYFDIAEGGVARAFPDGTIFFEEVPAEPPLRVLNGALFALLGVIEYCERVPDHGLPDVRVAAVEGMRRALPQFDRRFASLYDLRRRQVANAEYHTLHIALLDVLSDVCQVDEFRQWADKWRRCMTHPVKRMAWWCANYAWAVRRRWQGF